MNFKLITVAVVSVAALVVVYLVVSDSDVQLCVRENLERNYTKALEHCRSACLDQDGGSCVIEGSLYYEARGTTKNPVQAKKYWQMGCDLNEGPGCTYLGSLYYSGDGISQDLKAANTYYERGCDLHEPLSCQYLGNIRYDQNQVSESVDYYQLACALGDGKSCEILGNFYFQGTGVEVDQSKAQWMWERACSLGVVSACGGDQD